MSTLYVYGIFKKKKLLKVHVKRIENVIRQPLKFLLQSAVLTRTQGI